MLHFHHCTLTYIQTVPAHQVFDVLHTDLMKNCIYQCVLKHIGCFNSLIIELTSYKDPLRYAERYFQVLTKAVGMREYGTLVMLSHVSVEGS